MHFEQWVLNDNLSVFGLWMDEITFIENIYIKFEKTDGFSCRIINSLMASWGLCLIWLDCNFLKHFSKGCRCLNFLYQLICFCVVCIKGILKVNKPGNCARNQISVHNVVHPYRFTRDMLEGMRVLQQLDDKFIVGVLSQEGRIH